MNTNLDPEGEDRLLKNVLGDKTGPPGGAALKAQVLAAFRARQSLRRLTRWAAGVAAAAAAITCLVYWAGSPLPPRMSLVQNPSQPPGALARSSFLTDAQLLASFPPGSCFLAEVNGHKELIFLDGDAQRRWLARPEEQSGPGHAP
jgi:hypothetical protein